MHALTVALLSGVASGAVAYAARSLPLLGWLALAPLGYSLTRCGPWSALAGALAGALIAAPSVASPTLRALLPLTLVGSALGWSLPAGLAGELLRARDPARLVVLLPLCSVLGPALLRALGAPRLVTGTLAATQEPWPLVIHTARLGGDRTTAALLAVASASLVLALPTPARSLAGSLLGALVVALSLGGAALSMRRRRASVASAPTVRVAAVVVDGPNPPSGIASGLWPIQSTDYRDVAGTVLRYEPHVREAVARGAVLVVLPEVAVCVDAETLPRWLDAVAGWARTHSITVVAPYFDTSIPRNMLCVVDPDGARFTYEKQHPGRGLEPARGARMPPGPVPSQTRAFALSTVICVDLDYEDLVAPVRRAGGVLCAPSNDWFDGFELVHHRAAVWAAVETGATVVRATGHGISAVFDGSGRVLARASSAEGPVVLVCDAPAAHPL